MRSPLVRIVVAVLLVMVGFRSIRGGIDFAMILFVIAGVLVFTAVLGLRASNSLALPKDR